MADADLSVVVPNYNHARFIPRALDAILNQSCPAREIIIVDDASTDDSVSVIEHYQRRHPTIRLLRNEQNRGVVASLNRGLDAATSTYVLFGAADDYVLPGFFEKCMIMLAAHPHAGLCTTLDSFQLGENGPRDANPHNAWSGRAGYFTPEDVCAGLNHTIAGHATICRRDALLKQHGFHPELRWYTDWFALVTVAFRHGACQIPEMLSIRVLMPENYSAAAKPGPQNIAVLGYFLELMASPDYADVAPYFRKNGAATYFGTDLIRAAARRADRWSPEILGFLNGFEPEQYEELLDDPEPNVRAIAEFFLGPFWKRRAQNRQQQAQEIAQLQTQLQVIQSRIPPAGTLAQVNWLLNRIRVKALRGLTRFSPR